MEFLRLVKSGYDAFQAGDYLCALKCLTDAFRMALDMVHPDHKPVPMQNVSYNYTSAETCFEYLMQQCPDIDCENPKMENSVIITLLPVIIDLIRFIWQRRQQQ